MEAPFRVFHCYIELAGQMGALVKGLRRFGHMAVGYNTFLNYIGYRSDVIDTDLSAIQKVYEQTKDAFDVYHYHFGSTIYPDFHDLAELHAMGKKLVMHHWGNDVRMRARVKELSPFLKDPCNPYPDDVMIERTRSASRWIHTVIIQDFELYDYVKDFYEHVHVLPLAYDVASVAPHYPSRANDHPLIIHAPTQPAFKGTALIEETLDRLKAEGYRFAYRRIEKMDHAEALRHYQAADLIIDQMLVGTYGAFSVEAMAFGKPVVAYIRPDLVPKFDARLPIINADPASLHDSLIPWLTDARMRRARGVRSRRYAEQIHDLTRVIPQLLDIYRSL